MADDGLKGRITGHQQDTTVQLALSVAIGFGSFIGFCILRPRWTGLYAARKQKREESRALPDLPSSFLGWMLPIWRITDQQVLASAGLDAYVFLRFFRMASKYLAITCFFALAVIKPVHDVYEKKRHDKAEKNETSTLQLDHTLRLRRHADLSGFTASNGTEPGTLPSWGFETDYLWMYLVFAYLFSILMMYMIVSNTREIIEVRQEYLGSQTTITDRTIRLSGIPADLQEEDKIKGLMEELDMGKVESVTLCKDWTELDGLMAKRTATLRRLETALATHHGSSAKVGGDTNASQRTSETLAPYRDDADQESDGLLSGNGQAHVSSYEGDRPTATIRFGRFNLQSKKVDAISHYEEELKQVDARIEELRESDFTPVPMAFVTMDTVAAAQMAVQAVLDPSPLQLIANPSPAPENVVWENTYLSRRHRMTRAWTITAIIVVLTIFWSIILVPIATILNADLIEKIIPGSEVWLDEHVFVRSLIQTQLPTLIISLLNVAVPYLYEWLANLQGMTSRGDIELSVISKNFFFTFFNFFVVFTILGTASNAISLFQDIEKQLRNTTILLNTLAKSLGDLVDFYTNFLILQGLGLLPFKLLQVGALSLYPIYRFGAKTPRDYTELVQPSIFSYGLFLPQTLLIFDICLVYSVLQDSWKILLCGLAYFVIGGFVYKYQLLYAMDERQHSTGRSWIMMCDRVLVGLVVFQLTVAGQLVLKNIDARGGLLLPLVIATIWFSYSYNRTYRPLMKFIALRSVRRTEHLQYPNYRDDELPEDMARWRESPANRSRATSRSREMRMKFVNPNLIMPLEGPWTSDKGRDSSREEQTNEYGEA